MTMRPRGVLALALGLGSAVAALWFGLGGNRTVDYAACVGQDWQDCTLRTVVAQADRDGVTAALATLKLVLRSDPEKRNGCHELTHRVGEEFHERYGSDAVTADSRWCSYGYLHGVMTALGRQNPSRLVASSLELCRSVEGDVTSSCVHGIGHAGYLLHGEPDAAMGYCDELTGRTLRSSCAQGVLMQLASGSPDGLLPETVDATTCLSFGEDALVGGCALFVAGAQVFRGNSLDASCAPYRNELTLHDCRYGFGGALASTHLEGMQEDTTEGQRQECSAEPSCARGFGVSAYLYTGSRESSERLCRRLLDESASEACLGGVTMTEDYEDGLW